MYGQFGSCCCDNRLLHWGVHVIKHLVDYVFGLERTIRRDHLNSAEADAEHVPFVKPNLPVIEFSLEFFITYIGAKYRIAIGESPLALFKVCPGHTKQNFTAVAQ